MCVDMYREVGAEMNKPSLTMNDLLEARRKVGKILSELKGSKATLDILKSVIPPTNHAFLGFPPLGGVTLSENPYIPDGFLIPFDQYGNIITPIYQLEMPIMKAEAGSEGHNYGKSGNDCVCSIFGCTMFQRKRGLCARHYGLWRRKKLVYVPPAYRRWIGMG